MANNIRNWATPLATGAFIISAVTGVLIFFHIEVGLVEPVHKWLSWLLVVGIGLHAAANRKGFMSHFSRRAGLTTIGAAVLVTILSVSPFFKGGDEEHNRKSIARAAVGILEEAPLASVASLMGSTPAVLAERLGAKGITVDAPSMTLRQIDEQNARKKGEALSIVLAGNNGGNEGTHDDD